MNWSPRLREFPDGRKLYVFPRYGTWEDADIDGVGNVLSRDKVDAMLKVGGCCVAYTHLGKRPAHAMGREKHIPDETRAALRHIADLFNKRRLMVSPVGELLDYLVARNNIEPRPEQNRVLFRPDGIRYTRIDRAALKGMKFSFKASGFKLKTLRVESPDGLLDCERVRETWSVFSLVF